jgi:transcriptional regulator with XRE-family HTH domain
MATKAQHARGYGFLPPLLRALREEARLTQRELGEQIKKPQSWIYNCETANRRVDVTEFIAWARACDVEPGVAFARFLECFDRPLANKANKGGSGDRLLGKKG